ncbi:hypothetical protein GQ44DRAFT_79377 [Phaeosphaeriaceae sp. PMI808]|nr:hypothetical protein GQ44DRAFT_79377 [Phaeosphaeriaceae sp. PMI808]
MLKNPLSAGPPYYIKTSAMRDGVLHSVYAPLLTDITAYHLLHVRCFQGCVRLDWGMAALDQTNDWGLSCLVRCTMYLVVRGAEQVCAPIYLGNSVVMVKGHTTSILLWGGYILCSSIEQLQNCCLTLHFPLIKLLTSFTLDRLGICSQLARLVFYPRLNVLKNSWHGVFTLLYSRFSPNTQSFNNPRQR